MRDKKQARPLDGSTRPIKGAEPPTLREHKRKGRPPGSYGPYKKHAPRPDLDRDHEEGLAQARETRAHRAKAAAAAAAANHVAAHVAEDYQGEADGWVRTGVRQLAAAAGRHETTQRMVLLAATHDNGRAGVSAIVECDTRHVLDALGRLIGEVNSALVRDGVKIRLELRMRLYDDEATQNPNKGRPGGAAR